MRGRLGAVAVVAALAALGGEARFKAATAERECALVQALDGSAPFVSDAAECALKTAPASTFKVPHALIALETGVVTDPHALGPWDGTKQAFSAWEKPHSLDSAMKASVLWFYQRTAGLIGRERMLASLKRLGYGSDTYEGEQTFTMPAGAITNASGTHPFALTWPGPLVVRAKTGNATVAGERVSWVVGHVESGKRGYVFVARVRGAPDLSMQAGAELALRTLNARPPK